MTAPSTKVKAPDAEAAERRAITAELATIRRRLRTTLRALAALERRADALPSTKEASARIEAGQDVVDDLATYPGSPGLALWSGVSEAREQLERAIEVFP